MRGLLGVFREQVKEGERMGAQVYVRDGPAAELEQLQGESVLLGLGQLLDVPGALQRAQHPVGGGHRNAEVTGEAVAALGLEPGQQVFASFKAAGVVVVR